MDERLPTWDEVLGGRSEGPEVYSIDIRILRFKKYRTEDGKEALHFEEDLETPFDAVFMSESLAVTTAVARNLEGHVLRMLPIDEDATIQREAEEALL